MATLPIELGAERKILTLFQPQPSTRALFRTVIAPIGQTRGVIRATIWALIRNFWFAALIGAVPALILGTSALVSEGLHQVVDLVFALVLLVIGMLVGAAYAFARRAVVAIPKNCYGLCTGLTVDRQEDNPALSEWLDMLLNDLAGKAAHDGPLTFGDLWGTTDPARPRAIDLEMVTTSLTQRRPYRLPFETNQFYFDPAEFRRIFPNHVVKWMEDHARVSDDATRHLPRRPLPLAADLPVVVAARMSLSFPILMSAVPLYAIDYTHLQPGEERPLEPCWFSDGGITSNLPVHFFDQPLPSRPTFAINLQGFSPYVRPSTVESENVHLATNNVDGILEWWQRFGDDEVQRLGDKALRQGMLASIRRLVWPSTSLVGFFAAILDTMQNWRDNSQLHQPGYRDRIVHIRLSPDEGGLNLKMEREVIGKLIERGRWAGLKLRRRFFDPNVEPNEMGWDNQRWVRYRSTMSALEAMLRALHKGYTKIEAGERSYEELIRRDDMTPPAGYRLRPPTQQAFAEAATNELIALAEGWIGQEQSFTQGAPKPDPEMRSVPRI